MKRHLLEIDSVQKRFDQKTILSDVCLKCETGDIIGLLGRNGSGKSTLLKIIFGILPADNKFLRIDQKVQISSFGPHSGISYLHQGPFIPGHFSVSKALSLSISRSRLADFYKDEVIASLSNKKISQLSGGERRYLEIKLILENSSHFVLLDEPFNGLSPILAEKISGLIRESANRKGIIITDHHYQNVVTVANKLVLMKDGKMYHLNNADELVEKGYLKTGML